MTCLSDSSVLPGISIYELMNCDLIGCQRRYGIIFSKFAQENDLADAQFEFLPFAAAQQGTYILGCEASMRSSSPEEFSMNVSGLWRYRESINSRDTYTNSIHLQNLSAFLEPIQALMPPLGADEFADVIPLFPDLAALQVIELVRKFFPSLNAIQAFQMIRKLFPGVSCGTSY
jgi:hypothetical protein